MGNTVCYHSLLDYYEEYIHGVKNTMHHSILYQAYQLLDHDDSSNQVYVFMRGTALPHAVDINVPNSFMVLPDISYLGDDIPLGYLEWGIHTSIGEDTINVLLVDNAKHNIKYEQSKLQKAVAICKTLNPIMTSSYEKLCRTIYYKCKFDIGKIDMMYYMLQIPSRAITDGKSNKVWVEVYIENNWCVIMHDNDNNIYGPCAHKLIATHKIDPLEFTEYCVLITDNSGNLPSNIDLYTECKTTRAELLDKYCEHVNEIPTNDFSEIARIKENLCYYTIENKNIVLHFAEPYFVGKDNKINILSKFYFDL
jgi:hypothetical protein